MQWSRRRRRRRRWKLQCVCSSLELFIWKMNLICCHTISECVSRHIQHLIDMPCIHWVVHAGILIPGRPHSLVSTWLARRLCWSLQTKVKMLIRCYLIINMQLCSIVRRRRRRRRKRRRLRIHRWWYSRWERYSYRDR